MSDTERIAVNLRLCARSSAEVAEGFRKLSNALGVTAAQAKRMGRRAARRHTTAEQRLAYAQYRACRSERFGPGWCE